MNNPFQSFFRKKNQPEINQISQTKPVAKKAIRYVEMGMPSNIEDVYGLREKSIDYKSLVGSVSTAPAFGTFAKMYETYHYISTPIDRLVDEVVSLQPIFKKDGQEVEVEKLNSDILDTIVTHLIVFGQSIVAKDKTPRVLASSDINLWRMKGGEITAFNYLIENKNFTFEKPKDDFKIFTYKKINSPFFGTSPLKALYDEIFKVKLDAINTQDDFDHNARMGSIIIEPENISENSSIALKEAVKKLSDTRYRYSSQVLPHGTEVKTLEQTLVESLSKDEKERIERVCANQIGYPYQFLSSGSNGLGRGEQTTLRINLGVRVNKIQNIIKEIHEYLYELKDQGIEMSFEEFKINSQSEMITSATELVLAGILTPAEMKTKYLGYTEDTLRPIDKEGYTIGKGGYTIGEESYTIGKRGYTIGKVVISIGKEGYIIGMVYYNY